jgi:hypothetical protein
MVAAVAASVGLALAVMQPLARDRPRAWDVACLATGLVVATGSVLSLTRPPAFASPWLGPWVALIGGLIAAAAVVPSLRRSAEPEAANV